MYTDLLELREDNPREDNDMYFDKTMQQYILKKDYPLNRLFLDEGIEKWANTSKQFERILWEVSDDIYRYIERHTLRSSLPLKREIIKKDEKSRDVIKSAMLYQVRYYLRSGGGVIKDMHGVDIERSKALALSAIRGDRRLSPDTIDVLDSHPLLTYLGPIDDIRFKGNLL